MFLHESKFQTSTPTLSRSYSKSSQVCAQDLWAVKTALGVISASKGSMEPGNSVSMWKFNSTVTSSKNQTKPQGVVPNTIITLFTARPDHSHLESIKR